LSGTLVLLQDAADLPIHLLAVKMSLGSRDAGGQTFQRDLDPPADLVVHSLLFAAPVGRTAQDHGVTGLEAMRELDLDALTDRRQPPAVASSGANFFKSDFGAPMM
jgi:hypothetical protein